MRNDEPLTPAAFAFVLGEIFHGEPWDEVEPYAAKAWSQFSTQRWEDVRDVVLQHLEQNADY